MFSWVFCSTCHFSYLRPGDNFWLALSVTATPCQLPQGGSQVSPPPLGEVSCQRHDGEGNPPSGAHVHWWFAQARRSAAAQWRDLSRAATHYK